MQFLSKYWAKHGGLVLSEIDHGIGPKSLALKLELALEGRWRELEGRLTDGKESLQMKGPR